jgi:hypothetical protein
MAEFRPKQQKFDLFLAEFRPIFGVEILLCGFAHFWEKFDQNGRNEITVKFIQTLTSVNRPQLNQTMRRP